MMNRTDRRRQPGSPAATPWRASRFIAAAAGLTISLIITGCSGGGGSAKKADPAASASDRSEVLLVSGETSMRRGDRQRALAELTRAIEINPTLTRAHLNIADIHRSQGDYALAEASYRRAAEIEPQNFDAQYYDGLMLHLLDRLVDAVRAYLRALAIRPNDFDANLKIASAYYQLDETPQAVEYAKRAVKLKPDNGPARFQLGAIYAAMNDHESAVREYQQAAELIPLTPVLLLNLAESYGRLGRYNEMLNTLTQVVKTEPSAAAHERMGFAHWRLDQFDLAHADFQDSLRLDADYYPALNGLGVSCLRKWKESDEKDSAARLEGVRLLRRSMQINRDQPKVLDLLSRYGS
jgi:tetratricopeptide (TPR) repeat protein